MEQANDAVKDWNARNDAELAEMNKKSAVNFYGFAGMTIAIVSFLFGFTPYYPLALGVPLGLIVMGIGSILRTLQSK